MERTKNTHKNGLSTDSFWFGVKFYPTNQTKLPFAQLSISCPVKQTQKI
jgi:hypothetical protein